MTNTNLFTFSTGGVYCIKCLKTKKIYIGITASFLERAARHWTLLKNNTHECRSLQKDFDLYGSSFFEFKILCLENHFEKRFKLEREIISKFSEKKCYNSINTGFQKNKPVLAQQILINGVFYSSIRKAAELTNLSKSTIIRNLNDSKNLKYVRLKKEIVNYRKYIFLINGIEYLSTKQVIESRLATSDNQIRERCHSKNKKWKNWVLLKQGSNDYPDKE